MAAQDSFRITVAGRGGHGAFPHQTVDPVVAAALIVVALQPLVSRETSPTDGAVVTVARFNTGEQQKFLQGYSFYPMLFHRSAYRERFTPQFRCLLHAHGSTCVSRHRCAETAPACLAAGEGAPNVIPDAVSLTGTIRALLPERFVRLRARVQAVVEATAGAHGCAATVQWEERPYPPTRNDAALAAMVRVLAVGVRL